MTISSSMPASFGLTPPSTVTSAGISQSDPAYASKTYAQMTREQWSDYLNRFVPVENALISSYQNPGMAAAQISGARQLSDAAFTAAEGTAQRQAARYGLNMQSDPAYQRRVDLGQAAASTDAANMTRMHINDRDKMLLEGGISTTQGAGTKA